MYGWRNLILVVVLAMMTLSGVQAARAQGVAYGRGTVTSGQFTELAHVWDYPPGIYRFSPAYNDLCLGVQWSVWPEQPYVMQLGCGNAPDIAVMPMARASGAGFSGYYTFRAPSQIDAQGRLSRCATEARGVIIGPPRIDILPCDLQPGESEWMFAGGRDQKFSMNDGYTRAGRRTFGVVRIRSVQKCWTLRDSSRETLGDVVFETCAELQNQAFNIRYVGPITTPGDLAALNRIGWRPGPPGEPMRLAHPVRDVDFPGNDYASDATSDDYGQSCATRCAADGRCGAFTWTPRAEGQPAMCWLKTTWGAPQSRTGMYSGIVTGYRGPRV